MEFKLDIRRSREELQGYFDVLWNGRYLQFSALEALISYSLLFIMPPLRE